MAGFLKIYQLCLESVLAKLEQVRNYLKNFRRDLDASAILDEDGATPPLGKKRDEALVTSEIDAYTVTSSAQWVWDGDVNMTSRVVIC